MTTLEYLLVMFLLVAASSFFSISEIALAASRKQLDMIGATANSPGGLYNTFLYLKQVLGNLAHISLVIL